MSDNVKILVVDDERLLLTLMVDQLEKNGYITKGVETGRAALKIATDFYPDLVLLDIMLPDMNGLEVLKQIKPICGLDLSVILLTGKSTDSNDQARGLELGADDFILMPVSSRELLARIRAVLRLQQAKKNLRQSEERFRTIYEYLPIGYQSLDETGCFLDVNRAWLQSLGYTREEVIGKWFGDFLVPEQKSLFEQRFPVFKKTGHVQDVEFEMVARDGSQVSINFNGNIEYDAHMHFKQTHCVFSNITKRKQAEQSLVQSQHTLIHEKEVLLSLSKASQVVQTARSENEVFRAMQEQLTYLGLNSSIFKINPDTRKLHLVYLNYDSKIVRKAEKLLGLTMSDFEFKPRKGSIYERVLSQGETVYVDDAVKIVEDLLPAGLRKFARTITALFLMKASVNAPLIVNNELYGIIAVTGKDLTEQNSSAITAFANQAGIAIQNIRLYEQAQKEIAARKQAEESLKASETRYKTIFETVPISIWEEDFSWVIQQFDALRQSGVTNLRKYMDEHPDFAVNAARNVLVKDVNPISLTMFHAKDKKELLTSIDSYFSNSFQPFKDQLLAIWNNARFYEVEREHTTLDGGKIFVRMTIQFPETPEQFSRVYVLKADITAQKLAAEQQQFFYDVLSASVNEIYAFDAESLRFVFVSNGALANLGYSMDEMHQKTPVDIKPEFDREKFERLLKPLTDGKQTSLEFQTIHQRANGTTYPVEVDLQKISLEGQAVYLAVIMDITDRVESRRDLEESEQKFRLIVENAGLGVGYYNLDGRLVYLNSTAMKFMTGKLEDYVGKTLIQLYGEDVGLEYKRRINLAADSEESTHYEDQVTLPSGTLWFHSIYTRVVDSYGKIAGIQIISEEITEQKEIDDRIRDNEEKFRAVFESANVGKSLTLPGGEVRANRAFAEMLGYTQEEFNGKTWQMLAYPEDVEMIQKAIKPLLDGVQDSARFTRRYIHKDGSTVWCDLSTSMRRDVNGKPLHFITTVVDISDRKLAEESLQQTTQLLSLFIHHSPVYAFIKDVSATESEVLFASENYVDLIGVPGSQMVGKKMEELFPLEFAAKITADDWEVVSNGETLEIEEELNGRSYITLKFPIQLGSKKMLAGYSVDITDLKLTENKLRELSNRQEALLGAIPDILMETNLDKVYTWANPAGLEFFGPDVVGHEANEYFIGEQTTYKKVDTLFKGDERTIYVESWQRRADGEKRLLGWWCRVLLDAGGKPIGALSTARDITEKQLEADQILQLNTQLEERVEERTRELREAQEQIVRKEKLAFLGQLAGSVGHELRNPLAVISNAVYYLKMTNSNGDEKVKKYLDMIESETKGAEKIISDLLEFARTKSFERMPSKIVEMVNHSLGRLQIPKHINVKLDLPASLPDVNVDPCHVGQILENLVTNACEAMQDGGILRIGTRVMEKEGKQFIGIVVKDTGKGILPEHLNKLFEPLFTTKARGIGLGLAVCKKLAEVNEGFIDVSSEEGKGAEFILYLPVKGAKT